MTAAIDLLPRAISIAPMASEVIEKLRAAVRDVPISRRRESFSKTSPRFSKTATLSRASVDLFSRTMPRQKDRQDRRDRCARISFRIGRRLRAQHPGSSPLRKRAAAFSKPKARFTRSTTAKQAEMELHIDAIEPGEKIVLIDDLLATGGTSASAVTLIQKVGGDLVEAIFLIELEFLHGRKKLEPTPVVSFLKY